MLIQVAEKVEEAEQPKTFDVIESGNFFIFYKAAKAIILCFGTFA